MDAESCGNWTSLVSIVERVRNTFIQPMFDGVAIGAYQHGNATDKNSESAKVISANVREIIIRMTKYGQAHGISSNLITLYNLVQVLNSKFRNARFPSH